MQFLFGLPDLVAVMFTKKASLKLFALTQTP